MNTKKFLSKGKYFFLISCLIILVTILFINNKEYYIVENRDKNIADSKKEDGKEYETIGWLRIQGTNIDYPLYNVTDYKFGYPVVSKPYVWSLYSDNKHHNTMFALGHNIMNLGGKPLLKDDSFDRLEEIMGFVYYDFAKRNKYMQLTIDNKNYLYKIFSVSFLESEVLNSFSYNEFDKDDKTKYLDLITTNNIYNYNIDVNINDEILSIVTCSRFFGNNKKYNFIVSGRLIKNNEKNKNYSVKKSDNYKDIEKILNS